jgi:hypothetical protein
LDNGNCAHVVHVTAADEAVDTVDEKGGGRWIRSRLDPADALPIVVKTGGLVYYPMDEWETLTYEARG